MSDEGRPPSLDPADDAFLAGLAARVRGAGLATPALLWLASRLAGGGFALSAGLLALIVIALLVLLGRRQHHGRAAGGRWWAMLGAVLLFTA